MTFNSGNSEIRTLESVSNSNLKTKRADGLSSTAELKGIKYNDKGFSIDYNTGVSVTYDFVNVDDVYVETSETISDLQTDDNKSQGEEVVKNADEVLNNQTESDIIKDNIDEGGATNGERKETVYLRSADPGGSDNDTGREGKAVRTGKEIFRETSQEEIKRTDFVRHKGDKNTEIVFSQILPDDYTEEMISLAKKNSEINLETVFTDGKIELYDKNGNLIRIIEDGCYNKANRTIYINCQSKEKLENINEHEKVHAFKRINPTAYEDLLADDEISVISNAINDTLLSKAKLDIINKAKKHSVKNGIEVFAKNLKEEYEQKGTIEKYSGYFKDDGEKVVTLMSNSTSNTAKATLQDNDVANDRKKLYDVYRRMKEEKTMLKVELKTVMLSTEQRMEWRKKVENMNLSEEMKDTLSRWIVFKEEYKKITQFLTQNPTATEDEILHQMFEIVFQYEKEIGISRGHRECLSSNGSEFRSID